MKVIGVQSPKCQSYRVGKTDEPKEYELKNLWGQSEQSPELMGQNLKRLEPQEKEKNGTRAMSQELEHDLI